jgi:hypothetical protein
MDYSDAKLVEDKGSPGQSHSYMWANVLPSGAWTGDWLVVKVKSSEGAVFAFLRQKAPRQVSEDEVTVGQEQAVKRARARLGHALGREAVLASTKLVLSSPQSPSGGPVWFISFDCQGERHVRVIDGKTGKELRS